MLTQVSVYFLWARIQQEETFGSFWDYTFHSRSARSVEKANSG